METTLREVDDDAPPDWCVFVAAHPLERLVGLRRVLLRGASLELGRDGAALGEGGLADARISRQHARLEVDDAGALRVRDAGSSNGTFVNGARVEAVTLAPGDALRVGGVLLVSQRMRAHDAVPSWAPLAGAGPALARLCDALRACERDGGDVALCEEPGAGADAVARALHARTGGDGPLVELSLRGWSDRLPVPLEDALAGSSGGTVLLTALPPPGTLARALLRERLARPRAARAPRAVLVLDAQLASDAAALLEGPRAAHVLAVPPLRDRPEDLGLAARAHASARGLLVPALSPRGWGALLRAPWPRNLAQLGEVLERASAALAAGAPEDVPAWLAESRGEPATPAPAMAPPSAGPAGASVRPGEPAARGDGVAYELARSGKWFHLPSGERVSLHRREVLARALGALVSAREAYPGRVVTAEQLIEQVWPGERFVEGAAQNRLHVALSNLRQLGLRRLIVRFEDGYRLDPAVPVRLLDE